ncbi:MAG: aldehyde dehydrogenase family protein [Methylotenera sp.]|nr:aldehyde dehydrogenase family protein [Methylotenera sp.]PKO52654.1 MAG: aldehyde dehydrogenase [Betaproteobacteria bacterium HGW-Betaproteobacteria-20]
MNTKSLPAMDQFREFSSYPVSQFAQTKITTPPASGQVKLDETIAHLREAAWKFATLPMNKRIALVTSMQQGYVKVAEAMVQAGCMAKGISSDSNLAAEEWASGAWGVVRQLRLVRESLQSIASTGNTEVGKVKRTAAGNLAVQVYPNNAIDGMLFKDITVDVHMQAHITEQNLVADRASFYKQPNHQGKVALVLGAGNIASIGIMDVITKMFNEGKVCILKMNPVNAYLGPYIEEAFKAAIDQQFLAVVYGGAEVGRHLVYHPKIDEVHLTGSDKTYAQIVWGNNGQEADERRVQNQPLLRKPITAELGNVSPIIVVPGPYTDKEIRFQAEQIATAFTMNASFMCCAAKVLVMPKNWDGTARFVKALQEVCAEIPTRIAYYPGAEDRWQDITKNRSNVTNIGKPLANELPWTFISDLNPDNTNEVLFKDEPFCSVISSVQVGNANPIEFLQAATTFVNNRLWGTLSATLVVHPKSLKVANTSAAFEQAINQLKYGTIAVNTFIGLLFCTGTAPWGAYPGSTSKDIQSGNGFVHNTAMLEGIEKVVMRAPLTAFPKPAWLASHKKAKVVTQKLVAMEENASWAKVPGIVMAAMQG